MIPVLSLAETVHAPPPAPELGEPLLPSACAVVRRFAKQEMLTPRERDLAQYVSLGLTNHQIGAALGTSENTVRNQRATLFRKLEVSNRTELVARLSAQGALR